ncbi:SMP-30/gluconolactonase/LRE family protein [Aspergillus niger CBS 101883]|uniref:SMP-30/Gluconolactonase/LRE-like region domain-containing protein n=1 Tax=Aspergillus niger ATCC 13496 TaxID=1353008 RepID=A0A370C0P9_ASPNG|eukprot:XP_001397964.2 hypothetical protein ANI_1_1902144 [Aspergillus niger CBS 513.88]
MNNSTSSSGSYAQTASIPASYQYLLPPLFHGNLSEDFVSGTESAQLSLNSALKEAQRAAFISYDKEFDEVIGQEPSAQIVSRGTYGYAYEAGIWVHDLNQMWFTSAISSGPTYLSVLDLKTNEVTQPNLVKPHGSESFVLSNPNGGFYYDGYVYITMLGDATHVAGLVKINPRTLETSTVLNSYYGLGLPSVDDVSIMRDKETKQTHIFFSTLDLVPFGPPISAHASNVTIQLPNAFWSFTPDTETLRPVIPRSDVLGPNGVSIDGKNSYLYVTDTPDHIHPTGTGFPAIFRYTLSSENGFIPSNKQLFGFPRHGVADGLKVDAMGRVWTGEAEGVVVRNMAGKVIGIFNKEVFMGRQTPMTEMANFALAGDKLILLALDAIIVVQLAESIGVAHDLVL